MTIQEYQNLRARIDERYQGDLAALERIWVLFRGNEPVPVDRVPRSPGRGVSLSEDEKQARKRAYMKAYYARRSKGEYAKQEGSEGKKIPGKAFRKFLMADPTSGGRNGE